MFKQSATSGFAAITMGAFVFVLFGLPTESQAQWHRSNATDKGTISTTTLVLVGVGTVAAIFLIAKISKGDKKDKAKEGEPKAPEKEKQEGQVMFRGFNRSALTSKSDHSQERLMPNVKNIFWSKSIDVDTGGDNMIGKSDVILFGDDGVCPQFSFVKK